MQPHFPASTYSPARRSSRKISGYEWICSSPGGAQSIFGDVHHGQIQHFEQADIGWNDCLCFRDFPQLSVKYLSGIDCINQAPDI